MSILDHGSDTFDSLEDSYEIDRLRKANRNLRKELKKTREELRELKAKCSASQSNKV